MTSAFYLAPYKFVFCPNYFGQKVDYDALHKLE